MLPAVIRVLGLANAGERELQADRAEELLARRQALEAASECLEQLVAERGLADESSSGFALSTATASGISRAQAPAGQNPSESRRARPMKSSCC